MRKLLRMLQKDENTVSVGRFTAVMAFLLWFGLSLYLGLLTKAWALYETFCLAVVAFVLVQLGNKAIETKAFSIHSEKKGGANE
ncbi:MAG: hypothetical protein ACI3WS_07490 [Phascolarctobacterium sp.]